MRFEPLAVAGAFLIRQERRLDERGAFARVFCREEFSAHGLDPDISQCSVSINPTAGTLRGMHYQAEPFGEAKLVRATRGAVHDVLIDLREDGPTRFAHVAIRLDAVSGDAVYIPQGCAHGFLTLEPDTEVLYQMNRPYQPGAGRGVRWNDPFFAIPWPGEPVLVSDRDAAYADFRPGP